MNPPIHLLAKESLSTPVAVTGEELPAEIQWMPPGTHDIRCFTQQGTPVQKRVVVNEGTARTMAARLQELRTQAAEGAGDIPYLDFNHEDREASARVTGFRWAGTDPRTGGVRASVEWTEPGRVALRGRAYRRFSPSFHLNERGEVTGAPLNMGGLVNKAAFKTIQPIVAGAAGDVSERSSSYMDPTQLAADLAAANQKIITLEARLAATANTEVIKAKDAEIATLKSTIESLNTTIKAKAQEHAKAVVDAAVKAGKLAPQNTAIHAKWTEAIAANPELAETLNAMAANPALGTVINGAGASSAPAGSGQDETIQAKERSAAVEAYRLTHRCSHQEAWNAVRSAKPALFGAAK